MGDINAVDENGYPGTIGIDGKFDGGDTAAILGTLDSFDMAICKVPAPWSIVEGVPLRHPDTTKWYGQPDRFSRDQLIPILCSLFNVKPRLNMFYLAHKKRWFLAAWNTRGNGAIDMPWKFPDVCGPEVWALWIRLFSPWWAPAVLWLLDIQTLVGAIQWRWFTPKTNQVTRNHMLVCITMTKHSPSITTKLINKINDYEDLAYRWMLCNQATKEYPTYQYFYMEIVRLCLK